MQKLAMMMAVMILGMSPAHGYSIRADSGSLEVGGQVEVGGYFVGRTLQQAQLGIEDSERIRNRILRLGQDEAKEVLEEQREGPDPEGRNQVCRLGDETTPKTTEALRKGADAVRGRDWSHQGKSERK